MAHYCSECTYLNLKDPNEYGEYWCEKKLERHLGNEVACYRYCEAYNRNSNVSKSAYDYSEEKSRNDGCYLTTMVCDALKLPDNNTYLQTVRQFRKNVLQRDNKYKSLLVEYDIIGPKISKAVLEDPQKETIAKSCMENYLQPIVSLLHRGKRDKALCLYIDLTQNLKKLYNLENEVVTQKQIDEADIEKSGHGVYVKKRTISE